MLPKQGFGRYWCRAVVILLALCLPDLRAADGQGEEAITQLYQILYAKPSTAGEAEPVLFRALYWLRQATTLNDLSPNAALRAAYQRAYRAKNQTALRPFQNNTGSSPAPDESQYLADWHIACQYGLFTPENLARMQAGVAPTATDGPFAGQVIRARNINPTDRRPAAGSLVLGPESGPPASDAVPPRDRPFAPPAFTYPPPPSTHLPAQTPARNPLPSAYRPAPANRNAPMPAWQHPSAPVLVPPDTTAVTKDPPRILLQDLPFNGLMPMEGKTKLAIAKVTNDEISVSIVGERQVAVRYPNGGVMFNPSIENYNVPKTNPVRLPGISSNAYLIKDDRAAKVGAAVVRYYYIDTSINNGTTFRIAKVTESF